MELGPIWTLDIIIAVVSTVIMLSVLAFYLRKAREIKSRFSVGLCAFSLIFVVQNIIAVVAYFTLAQRYSADVALPLLALHVLGLTGFGVLAWIINQ